MKSAPLQRRLVSDWTSLTGLMMRFKANFATSAGK
jgi:hypothetical protein